MRFRSLGVGRQDFQDLVEPLRRGLSNVVFEKVEMDHGANVN